MRRVLALAAAWAVAAAAAPPARVYVVSRAATIEARALLSGRLVGLNASSLQWIENSGVVRVELPPDAVEKVKSDKDVVVVFSTEEGATSVCATPSAPIQSVQAMQGMLPAQPPLGMEMGGLGMGGMTMGGMGMGGMGMGAMGMPMSAGITNMLDLLAGTLARRMLVRTPACHMALKDTRASFNRAGGDGILTVKASGTCAWQAQASVDWIQINSGAGAGGSGVVTYTVKPAPGKDRTGMISLVSAGAGAPLRGAASLVVTQSH